MDVSIERIILHWFTVLLIAVQNDPEFRKMRPDRVDGGSLLADQKMAGAMKHQAALLLDRLDRHEPHVGPRDRFANRLRVGRVILLSLDIRLHDIVKVGKWAPPPVTKVS